VGEATTRTLNEIAAARAALDRDLDALEGRLPGRAQAAYGAAGAGGGLAALGLLARAASKAAERRKHEKALEHDAQVQARAIAAAFAAHQLGASGRGGDERPAGAAGSASATSDDGGGSFLRILLAVLLAVVGAIVATKVRDQRTQPLWVDEVGDQDLAG
jgi:hypothetical protein